MIVLLLLVIIVILLGGGWLILWGTIGLVALILGCLVVSFPVYALYFLVLWIAEGFSRKLPLGDETHRHV